MGASGFAYLCVWCYGVWVAMAVLLGVERISILKVAFGGDMLWLESGGLLGGLSLMSAPLYVGSNRAMCQWEDFDDENIVPM